MRDGSKNRRLAASAYEGGPLRCSLPQQSFELGSFKVSWSGADGMQLTILHTGRPDGHPEKVLFRNTPFRSFLTAGIGKAKVTDARGFFCVQDSLRCLECDQVIDHFGHKGGALTISGHFASGAANTWQIVLSALDDRQLSIEARAKTADTPCNRLCLVAASRAEEEFFGFGAQYTHLRMKGRRIPVLSQEPGIGRGIQPLTGVMQKLFKAGGTWSNSYAPSPMFLSTDLRALCLENSEYSVFDLSPVASLRVGAFTEVLRGRLFWGHDPASLLEAYTRFCGRMRPLPSWVQQGAIIGMQGGTSKVLEALAELEENKTAIAGFWLQDWVGRRKTAIGSQLWWNWELDEVLYPGWKELVAQLRSKDIRVLTYLNPFIVKTPKKGNAERNLYEEALEKGFFVKQPDGAVYNIKNTTFSAPMLDLTNPGCREYLKGVIKENLISVGASGWMADYAEALPFNAQLHGNQDAASYHNEYPVEWAKLNREAIAEAGLEDDVLFFTRSGYHQSPGYTTCFWLGDQLTSWRQEDGIKSVVVGLISSGLSGMSLNHADIGGYTSTAILPVSVPLISFKRSQELLMRWIEMSAFTPIFRTHEGNIPRKNHQITDAPETIKHFARFSRIYAALAEYRATLCEEAAKRGLPLVRHPWLHYPDDPDIRGLKLQYLFGSEFMVAPVLDHGRTSVRLYLPAGSWTHLWSGQEVRVEGPTGSWYSCAAPMGAPPVFFRGASTWGRALVEKLGSSGDGCTESAATASPCRPLREGSKEYPRRKSWMRTWSMGNNKKKIIMVPSDTHAAVMPGSDGDILERVSSAPECCPKSLDSSPSSASTSQIFVPDTPHRVVGMQSTCGPWASCGDGGVESTCSSWTLAHEEMQEGGAETAQEAEPQETPVQAFLARTAPAILESGHPPLASPMSSGSQPAPEWPALPGAMLASEDDIEDLE